MNFTRWVLRETKMEHAAVALVFLSKINANSPRFTPLFDENNLRDTRIVTFNGLRIQKTDKILLTLFKLAQKMSSRKLSTYKWFHTTDYRNKVLTNQFLHLDDPDYSPSEQLHLSRWAERLKKHNLRAVIICTNYHTANYLRGINGMFEIRILPQGFTKISSSSNSDGKESKGFSCSYSSPYIDYKGDRHEAHTAWGAKTLIDEILPLLEKRKPEIKVNLIGRLGQNARMAVSQFTNVQCHGLVGVEENARILRATNLGIYPRKFDHKRSVQKITEYIGAGLPVVTFDLVDTSLVKEFGVGISVETSEEFVDAIIGLSENRNHYIDLCKKAKLLSKTLSWDYLALELESWY